MKINQGLSYKASYDPIGVLAFEGDDWRTCVTVALGWTRLQSVLVLRSSNASVRQRVKGQGVQNVQAWICSAALPVVLVLTCRQQSSSLRAGSHPNPA